MPVAYPIIITRMIAAANIPPGTFWLLGNPPADAMRLWRRPLKPNGCVGGPSRWRLTTAKPTASLHGRYCDVRSGLVTYEQ